MYLLILSLHNILRWVVFILVLTAMARAWWGWFGQRDWSARDRLSGSFATMTIDIQVLLGLLLYVFFSPTTKGVIRDLTTLSNIGDLHFFALEHTIYMLLAVVFAHLGSVLPRKTVDKAAKHRRAAIWFTLTLLLIILGMPWARPLLPGSI